MKKVNDSKQLDIDENKALMAMYHSGNPDLKEEAIVRLFEKAEMFIWHFIKKQHPTLYGDPYYNEELFSCCKIAFLENIKDFDPEKGTLSTFLTLPFKHEMYEWVNRDLNDASGYHAKMMIQVQDAQKTLWARNVEPTPAAISNLTGLSVKKVEQTLLRIEAKKTQTCDSEEQWEEAVKGNCKSPEEMFLENEEHEALARALKILPAQDRIAIILHFGLDGSAPRSYSAVAKKMHISAPQAQASITRGLHILRGDTSLRVMFGRGAQNFRQAQLDGIEISLVTNENFINAYDVLDEEFDIEPTDGPETKVFLKF